MKSILMHDFKIAFSGLFRYSVLSAVCLLVDIGCYLVLIQVFGFYPPIAGALGYSIGLLLAYFLMTKYLWDNESVSTINIPRIALFICSGFIGTLFSAIIVFLVMNLIDHNVILAKMVSISIVFPLVFLLRKFIIFGNKINAR